MIFGSSAAFPRTLQDTAWKVLDTGISERNTGARAVAVGALGVLQGNPRAVEHAEEALQDRKPAVPVAAATALGQMIAISVITSFKQTLMDKDSLVSFAAADSLIALEDPTGYEMYFEELTGEQKIQEGLIAEKKEDDRRFQGAKSSRAWQRRGICSLCRVWLNGLETVVGGLRFTRTGESP